MTVSLKRPDRLRSGDFARSERAKSPLLNASAAGYAVPAAPPLAPRTAWAAARRAIGMRNGEQLT